jgi:protein phosphatase
MGGHADGALAAQLAVEHGLKAFLDSEASLADRLDATWRAANRAIADAAHQSQPGPGRTIGCTFILAAVSESGVAFVSVGDSVIYRWRGGALERLNEDHSYGAILETEVRAGLMTQAEAAANPRRHRLVSALTGDRVPCVDLQAEAIQLDAGDRLLIASDGIIALGMEDAARLMDGEAAEEIARALLQTLREGTTKNLDNTTVAVVMRQDR